MRLFESAKFSLLLFGLYGKIQRVILENIFQSVTSLLRQRLRIKKKNE